MGQKKLERFKELDNFRNVLQFPKDMKGNWDDFFKNSHPITLELACGKGEYALGLGKLFPDDNFIGVDLKGNRLWRGAKTALETGLHNVAFLRTDIDKLADYFDAGEVKEIWITFPDPQPRGSKMKKRLTHPKFLRLYQYVMQHNGVINLKTDSPGLYEFTKEVINLFGLELLADFDGIYQQKDISEALRIKTYYEELDIAASNKVHYLQFRVNKALPLEKDIVLKEIFCGQPVD